MYFTIVILSMIACSIWAVYEYRSIEYTSRMLGFYASDLVIPAIMLALSVFYMWGMTYAVVQFPVIAIVSLIGYIMVMLSAAGEAIIRAEQLENIFNKYLKN